MKLPFRRKKLDPSILPEVDEYYIDNKQKTGIAWVLALGTLVITIAIALGLFLGGRWLYRKLVKNDKGTETAQPQSPTNTPGVTGQVDNSSPVGPQLQGSQSEPNPTPSAEQNRPSETPRTGPDGPESEQ